METKTFTPPLSQRQARFKPSGMALVLTVFILGMLTILVIGFLSSMMTEEKAATAYEQSQRTKLVAEGAVSHAIDILRTNIPEPARLAEGPAQAPAENWITNPGRLTILRKDKDNKDQFPEHIPLHTGEVTTAPPTGPLRDAESVDLNKPLPGQTTPAITPGATSTAPRPIMRVKWANVLQDPSSPASSTNKLSARYAFWIDDESTKLNFNTALGKPIPAQDARYANQYSGGFMPPIFKRGGDETTAGGGERTYGLGKPESVNLDVLFSQPKQLLHDKRLSHTFLNGFYRYPEAIMDFVDVPDPRAWYEQNKFSLTFYNRSPEFNAFGRSRLFTSYVPLSLEAGPSYQQPFIYDPNSANGVITPKGPEGDLIAGTLESGRLKDDQILSLNSLLGFFGASAQITGPSGYVADKANMINRNQIRTIMEYLRRKWPGYDRSFVDKYGEIECFQLALNILQFARMSTTMIGTDLAAFSNDWGTRSTSVLFFPNADELGGNTPERFYWRVKDPVTKEVKLMLPQMPGPHVTEVRLFVEPVIPSSTEAPKSGTLDANSRYIKYWYEVECYMHPFGPVVDLKEFPIGMDYFHIAVDGGGKDVNQQFGPADSADQRADKQWQNKFMTLLAIFPAKNTKIGPAGATQDGQAVPNRVILTSQKLTYGKFQRADANAPGGNSDAPARKDNKVAADTGLTAAQQTNIWDPVIFDKSQVPTYENSPGKARVTIRLRPGQGLYTKDEDDAPRLTNRPRQMVPLGLTQNDTLQAVFNIDLNATRPQVASWQIEDPRLSHDLTKWLLQGPGYEDSAAKPPIIIGTPLAENVVKAGTAVTMAEPLEGSSEKSKFRYIQRAPAGAKLLNYNYDRPDEYVTTSRVSSPGYWSLLHTGMQSGVPWRTVNLGLQASGNPEDPPDWLLLDLFGATYPMAHDQWKIDQKLPDSFSTASYMGSTAGQVNINSRIYPQTPYFNPPERTLPLTGVFKQLRSDSLNNTFVKNIGSYQTPDQVFDYIGELTNVPGYEGNGGSQWNRELYLRNMAGVLTTRTNTFGLWGVAQTIQKSSRNSTHDAFEAGDRVTGEKRFFALIERYIWPGRDGVPGNGHISNGGKWDRLARQTSNITTDEGVTDTLFQLPGSPPMKRSAEGAARLDLDDTGTYPTYDGPEAVGMDIYTSSALGKVEYLNTRLEDAYNPPQAAIKYRVVYFKYLDQ